MKNCVDDTDTLDDLLLDDLEDAAKEALPKAKRILTNDDILKYEPMVEKWIRDSVVKNWNEASTAKSKGDIPLGNSGFTVNDIRQHLRAEVCVALQKYNPDYRTEDGRSVKESTFIYQHLWKRIGQLMKRLTKRKMGYGVWHSNIEETLWETDKE